jgi:ribosome-binding factor A
MKHRQLRLNELVKRELSAIIARELNFEGALVSINDVDVAPDMRNAHVFVSVLGSTQRENVMNQLEENRPALQAALSRKVILKYTPHLVFHLDRSIERGTRVIEILQQIESPENKE